MKFIVAGSVLFLTLFCVPAAREASTQAATGEALVLAAATEAGIADGGDRDTVDVALDYVRARVNQAKHDNARLDAKLTKVEHTGADAREKLARADARLQEVPKLRNRVDSLLTEKNQALVQLSQEWAREKALTNQLQNVSQVSMRRGRTLARARVRLSKELRGRQDLALKLKNLSVVNAQIRGEVVESQRNYKAVMDSAATKDQELSHSRTFINHMRASLHALQQTEKQDATRLEQATLEKEKSIQRDKEAEFKLQEEKQDDATLKQQLFELSDKEGAEVQMNKQYATELSREQQQAHKLEENQRDSQQRRKDEQAKEHSLREEVLKLQSKLAAVEGAKQQAQEQAKESKDDLVTAQAEAQEVKGTVPWLQAKVAQSQLQAENATSQLTEANKERDDAKHQFSLARQKIMTLEQQYAEIVKMVGKSVSQGKGLEDQSDVGALTLLVHGAVSDVPSNTQPAAVPDVTIAAQPASVPDVASPDMSSVPDLSEPAVDTTSTVDDLVTSDSDVQAVVSGPPPALRGGQSAPPAQAAGSSSGLEQDSAGLEAMLSGIPDAPGN